jgi:hypothetical protein
LKSKADFLLAGCLLACLVLSGCTLPALAYARARESRQSSIRGSDHTYVVQPAPKILTDEIAAARARETLAAEGYKPDQWELTWEHRSRNKANVRFTKDGRFRLYSVQLRGDQVVCYSYRGTQRDWKSWESRPRPATNVGRGSGMSR